VLVIKDQVIPKFLEHLGLGSQPRMDKAAEGGELLRARRALFRLTIETRGARQFSVVTRNSPTYPKTD
jgi:hypothetical protein